MLFDNNSTKIIPHKNGQLNQNSAVQTIINFIGTNLPNFRIDFDEIISKNKEGHYNKQLEDFFQRIAIKQSTIFFFRGNSPNLKDSYPDLSTLKVADESHNSFFDIECKRLYNKNKKEYVTGRTGGIERFKKNLHGTDLYYSAMIGYIENENEAFWISKINFWIESNSNKNKAFWNKSELLEKTNNQILSKHSWINSSINHILLHHFWINVAQNQ